MRAGIRTQVYTRAGARLRRAEHLRIPAPRVRIHVYVYTCAYTRVRMRAQVLARDAQTVELLLERGAG